MRGLRLTAKAQFGVPDSRLHSPIWQVAAGGADLHHRNLAIGVNHGPAAPSHNAVLSDHGTAPHRPQTRAHGMMGMRFRFLRMYMVGAAMLSVGAAQAPDYRSAARSLDGVIRGKYAYLDKLPGGIVPDSKILDAERDLVSDRNRLLHYAEDRLASLADHHAITGSSFADSWAVVPTYADLWVVEQNGVYTIDAVRDGSPAAAAGIRRGDRLVSVGGVPTPAAVAAFWQNLGLGLTPRRAAYAARVLAAGRRDRNRELGIEHPGGALQSLTLPSLYTVQQNQPLLWSGGINRDVTIKFNNSLGDNATVAAFDQELAELKPKDTLTLDLRDTPSGGNSTVARAVLGWFVDRPRSYQIHNLPEEERSTGIARQWVEQVLPRAGKHRDELPKVLVGRWTGSMGEGLAIGFAALGARVRGDRMAGLNGAVEDIELGDTGVTIKLPTERVMTVTGQPREDFVPEPAR
jgi:carboxyl-terminal processing protease